MPTSQPGPMNGPLDLEGVLPGARHLFRPEIGDDPDGGFDRDEQIAINAHCLEAIRERWRPRWNQVRESLAVNRRHAPELRGVREMKTRMSDLIARSDESADHRRTVSFVSKGAVLEIQRLAQARPARRDARLPKAFRLTKGLLHDEAIGHEHGTPRDVISRILVARENAGCSIAAVLDALSCRALMLRKTEILGSGPGEGSTRMIGVDTDYFSSVPSEIGVGDGLEVIQVRELPLRFLPLARYHAANPALLASLVPNGERARRLLADFLALVSGDEAGRRQALESARREREAAPIAFLPDSIFGRRGDRRPARGAE